MSAEDLSANAAMETTAAAPAMVKRGGGIACTEGEEADDDEDDEEEDDTTVEAALVARRRREEEDTGSPLALFLKVRMASAAAARACPAAITLVSDATRRSRDVCALPLGDPPGTSSSA